MDSDEFILAINPDPTRQNVRIEKTKYDIVREAILDTLYEHGPLTSTQLGCLLEDQLQNDFDGSVMWYYTTVKLDMEARGELRRVPKFKAQLTDSITEYGK